MNSTKHLTISGTDRWTDRTLIRGTPTCDTSRTIEPRGPNIIDKLFTIYVVLLLSLHVPNRLFSFLMQSPPYLKQEREKIHLDISLKPIVKIQRVDNPDSLRTPRKNLGLMFKTIQKRIS